MNFAYFRQSQFDFDQTVKNLKDYAGKNGLKILNTTNLENDRGQLVQICSQNWLNNLVASDKNLFGFLPCSVLVLKEKDKVLVGVSDPSLLGKLSQQPAVIKIGQEVEKTLKDLVNQSCGVGPLKVKKIKLYATMSCPYCKMEASWLEENKVKFDHILVDLNPKAGEEMVKKTGQMGVPVTEIVYDNDEEDYIIGFDKQKLTEILNIKN